jgi:hypothetical protein
LDDGVLNAAEVCLEHICPGNSVEVMTERVAGGRAKVDYVVRLGDNESHVVLVEAKSHGVMKKIGEDLPTNGIELKWTINEPLAPKIFQKVSTRVFRFSTHFDDS